MNQQLDKLNRLRVNAGKNELKAWKSTPASLEAQIAKFEADGFTDALPGADIKVVPTTTDPEIMKALETPEVKPDEVPSLADSALSKSIDTSPATSEPAKPATRGRASLARGLDTDTMAQQSRMAVQMARSKEKKEKKAADDAKKPTLAEVVNANTKVKLSKKDKKAIKEQAAAALPKGAVDPKVDPEKAKRQAKHIEEKKAKREAEGKTTKPKASSDDKTITAADLARDLNIDPKVARAKLRRYEGKADYPATVKGERWVFPKSALAALTAILDKK